MYQNLWWGVGEGVWPLQEYNLTIPAFTTSYKNDQYQQNAKMSNVYKYSNDSVPADVNSLKTNFTYCTLQSLNSALQNASCFRDSKRWYFPRSTLVRSWGMICDYWREVYCIYRYSMVTILYMCNIHKNFKGDRCTVPGCVQTVWQLQ